MVNFRQAQRDGKSRWEFYMLLTGCIDVMSTRAYVSSIAVDIK